jgi:hypothetical protein
MRSAKSTIWILAAAIVAALLASACNELPEKPNDEIPDIPVPTALSALAGQDTITISWEFDAGFEYSGFAVSRSENLGENWWEVAVVQAPPYSDTNVRTGVVYLYRVAGVDNNGIRGYPSAEIPVQASLYAVLINAGATYTNDPNVLVGFTAPAETRNVRLSEDPGFSGAPWLNFASPIPFALNTGDGLKTVYAQFRDVGGNETGVVADSITLDTYSEIDSLDFATINAPADTIAPGGSIYFIVVPLNNELGGFAQVFIEGQGATPVIIRDEGVGGDDQAGDGIYETDYTFAQFFRQASMRMSSIFVDAAGNESADTEFERTLYMSDPPDPVNLIPLFDIAADSLSMRWERSDETHFASYNIYRDVFPNVNPTRSVLATKITQQDETTYIDTGLQSGTMYYYRVYVVNDLDEKTASNEVSATTL